MWKDLPIYDIIKKIHFYLKLGALIMEFDFFEMEAHAKDLMDYCQTHMNSILKSYNGKELNVDNDFSLDTSINAQSELNDGQYKVKLNNGVYVAVLQFYQSRFFEDPDKSYYYKLTETTEYSEETARYYYDLMLDITLLSFIFHEYGHVYNGHLEYLVSVKASKKHSASFISLNANGEQPIITFPIRHQALEWNADDFSATRVIETIFGYHYWKFFNKDNKLSFSQLFWVVVNAMLVSFCLMGSKKDTCDLQSSIHLPSKFRAFAFINTAEKKLKKWTGIYNISQATINDAIDLTKSEAEIYDIDYRFNISKEEKIHYIVAEYDLLVKLPVILMNYQHLQNITPELALQTMIKLYDTMTPEEQESFKNMSSATGKRFSEENLRNLVKIIENTEK